MSRPTAYKFINYLFKQLFYTRPGPEHNVRREPRPLLLLFMALPHAILPYHIMHAMQYLTFPLPREKKPKYGQSVLQRILPH